MKIIYSATYKAGSTTHIAIHHSGAVGADPYSSSAILSAGQISNAHKERWNFPSAVMKRTDGTPWYGGYNFYIDKFGNVDQFRAIGEETAAQFGYNMNGAVISICFSGNHTLKMGKIVDEVTPAQITAYKDLVCSLPRVPLTSIVPHRHFGKTECYGNAFDDKWAAVIAGHAIAEQVQGELNAMTANSCKVAGFGAMEGVSAAPQHCSEMELRG